MILKYLSARQPNERNSQYIYRVLKEHIMTLVLYPGYVLNETILLKELQMSRTPLREAVFRLKSEHLVEVIPQRSSYVSLIDFNLVKEARYMRNVIEPEIINMAMHEMTPPYLEKLKHNMEVQRWSLTEAFDAKKYFELDEEFHALIYELVQMQETWLSIKEISTHFDRLRYLEIFMDANQLNRLYEDHLKIMDAFIHQDNSRLNEVMIDHIKISQDVTVYLKKEYQGYFKNLIY